MILCHVKQHFLSLKFINYLFRNIDLFDIDKFLILSGSVLYSHGIRQCSDVDFFINHNPKVIKTPNFKNKIETFKFPCSKYALLMSVISNSPRFDGLTFFATSMTLLS